MAVIPLYIATEDALSETVAERLVAEVNHGLVVAVRIGRRGNGYLRAKLPELRKVARSVAVLLLTDLDRTDCPPTLIADWNGDIGNPPEMLFRVAVREIEAWLLADRQGFADFFHVPMAKLPANPESIDDPKRFLLHLVSRHGRREAKSMLLPERGSKAKIGLGYNQMLGRFVADGWSIERACTTSDSLDRARRRLRELTNQGGHRRSGASSRSKIMDLE
ncbi:MAG: hypothetical protein AB1568_07390 [Thermodesulfobacteriota bacterium]